MVRAIPLYQTDKRYGCITSAYVPLNCIMLVVAPFLLLFDKRGKTITKDNSAIQLFFYLPLSLVATVVFVVFNILSLPVAYVTAIITKYKLLKKRRLLNMSSASSTMDLSTFVVVGWAYLLLGIIKDTAVFYKHLFASYEPKVGQETLNYLNLELFEKIEIILEHFGG